MPEEFNPYAAPTSTAMHPRAAEWLRSTDDPSLQKVAQGLGLIYTGTIILIAVIILAIILVFLAAFVAGGGGAMMVIVIAALVFLAAAIMIIVGTLMCLATPEESGAKGLIIASVALYAIGICLSLYGDFADNKQVEYGGGLAIQAGYICFLLFLKQLSTFIGAPQLVERARLLLILLGVSIGLIIFAFLAISSGMPALALLARAIPVIALISLFLYLGLLDRLRKAIQSGGAAYV